jgi:hypothetical protein
MVEVPGIGFVVAPVADVRCLIENWGRDVVFEVFNLAAPQLHVSGGELLKTRNFCGPAFSIVDSGKSSAQPMHRFVDSRPQTGPA